jgi:hypothetical protein
MIHHRDEEAQLENLSGPGWGDYLAARSRFLKRLETDRVLREAARRIAGQPTPPIVARRSWPPRG